jgi:hypothetical protein
MWDWLRVSSHRIGVFLLYQQNQKPGPGLALRRTICLGFSGFFFSFFVLFCSPKKKNIFMSHGVCQSVKIIVIIVIFLTKT